MRKCLLCPFPLGWNIKVFSASASAGWHYLPSKTVINLCWQINQFYDTATLWINIWRFGVLAEKTDAVVLLERTVSIVLLQQFFLLQSISHSKHNAPVVYPLSLKVQNKLMKIYAGTIDTLAYLTMFIQSKNVPQLISCHIIACSILADQR